MRETLNFLMERAGEELGYSPEEIAALQRPDEVHNYDLGNGVLASRTIHRGVPDRTGQFLESQGGTRVEVFRDGNVPDMAETEANSFALAANQSLKNIMAGIPEGGAKAKIFIPESVYEQPDGLERVLGEYVKRHAETIMQGDGHGPDMRLEARHMDLMADTLVRISGNSKVASLFTGKSVGHGGVEGRLDGTSHGLLTALKAFDEADGFELNGLRVAIEGSGNVGYHFARLAQEAGVRVMGMSDVHRAVAAHDLCGAGLQLGHDIQFDQTDIAWFNELSAHDSMRPSDLHELDVDLFVFAGPSGSRTVQKQLGKLAAPRVAFGANTPLDKYEIEQYESRGGVIYPDIVVNPGGVIGSSIERHHGPSATAQVVYETIDEAVLLAVYRTVAEAKDPTDYLRAANRIALRDLYNRDQESIRR